MRLFTRPRAPFVARFYNLRVGRRQARAALEIDALLTDQPEVLGLVEAIGYNLPEIPGYVLVRDTSTLSRENVAAYVREDIYHPRFTRWHDLATAWLRTERPGIHEPRSFLDLRAGDTQVVVYHAPPPGIRDPETRERITVAAQQEGIDAIVHVMAPWTRERWHLWRLAERMKARGRSRILLADMNRDPDAGGPGALMLAEQIDGQVIGNTIDLSVGRHVDVVDFRNLHEVDGVDLLSDHRRALHVDLLVKVPLR